jgi:hypothetical protein
MHHARRRSHHPRNRGCECGHGNGEKPIRSACRARPDFQRDRPYSGRHPIGNGRVPWRVVSGWLQRSRRICGGSRSSNSPSHWKRAKGQSRDAGFAIEQRKPIVFTCPGAASLAARASLIHIGHRSANALRRGFKRSRDPINMPASTRFRRDASSPAEARRR